MFTYVDQNWSNQMVRARERCNFGDGRGSLVPSPGRIGAGAERKANPADEKRPAKSGLINRGNEAGKND
jgi:hypothetical protein